MPSLLNLEHPSRKAFDKYCKNLLDYGCNESIIEIGCFPGRYLIYSNKTFAFKIYGIEYSDLLCKVTLKNLKICGVNGTIYAKDLFNHNIKRKFDIVFSAAFIEHFVV